MLDQESIDLYDRQIRLFGFDTQKKLMSLNVEIYSEGEEFTSGEIAKNFILLGCGVKLNKNALNSLANIWKDYKFNTINHSSTLLISVDSKMRADFYLCTNSLSYSKSYCECHDKKKGALHEILLGGVFVQEMVKMIEEKNFKESFELSFFD